MAVANNLLMGSVYGAYTVFFRPDSVLITPKVVQGLVENFGGLLGRSLCRATLMCD